MKKTLLIIWTTLALCLIALSTYAIFAPVKTESKHHINPPIIIASALDTEPTIEPTITPTVEPTAAPTEKPRYYFDTYGRLPNEWQDYVYDLCAEYYLEPEFVMAVIYTESSYRADAISGTNDYGLMQINKMNFEWLTEELGVTDFLDPYENVRCGCYILHLNMDKTDGDKVKALMYYNNGELGTERLNAQGIYSTHHTDKVMSAYESYARRETIR